MNVAPAELKFGGVAVESPRFDSIPCAFIVGAVCGLLGAFFVVINSRLFKLRKKHIKTNC
jgi:H+/Cl- antiporter ClcA